MKREKIYTGIFLIVISAVFGGGAFRYGYGSFSNPGPGLFPLIASALLFIVGLIFIGKSFFLIDDESFHFRPKSAIIILASICGFAILLKWFNLVAATFFLVFISSIHKKNFKSSKNLVIFCVLLAIAFVFSRFLGMNLRIW